jgi:DMSO/TMAO reductase YedYZ heme-binding membrane subunit
LLFVFAAFIAVIVLHILKGSTSILILLATIFTLLGLALVILTAKLKEPKKQKVFFILTGASALGIPVFAILHNVVYGLFIKFFGEDFWGKGGDEPVFFLLALIVCPIIFLVGTVGSIVFLVKAKHAKPPNCAEDENSAT